MSVSQTGRMLLSHNFTLDGSAVSALSRAEFVQAIAQGLATDLTCTAIDNPHWVAEVTFDPIQRSPEAVGRLCAESLVQFRKAELQNDLPFQVLALGGCKQTPPSSSSPTALQTGDWGVDMVETISAAAFLQELNWDAMIANKAPETIFRVEL